MSIYRDNEFNPDELEAEILKGTLTDEQLKPTQCTAVTRSLP